jgi:glycosyltransferase involved in cell wall biosynthesis
MLQQALASALDQDVELEVIVVDDGSADDTQEVLSRIDDDRLTVIRNEQPMGVARARNAAIERAKGEWIAFLDDDDLWAPGKLRTQLDHSHTHDHVLCFSTIVYLGEANSVRHITRVEGEPDVSRVLLVDNIVGGPSGVLVRADVLRRVGGFDDRLSALADWDLWIRATRSGTVGICAAPLVAYRHHDESMTKAEAGTILAQFELMQEKHGQEAADAGVELGAEWRRRWQASQELASGHRLRAARGYVRSALRTRNPRDLLRAVGALGGNRLQRLGRRAEARILTRPPWLDRYV